MIAAALRNRTTGRTRGPLRKRQQGRDVRIGIFACVALGLLVTSAFNTYDGNKLIGGVGGRHYWIDGSVGGALEAEIYSAKWLWGNSTSKVSWALTQSKSSSAMEFYESSTILPGIGVCGMVKFYGSYGNEIPFPPAWSWNKSKVLLSDALGSPSCPNERGIIIHEIGHVMGLDHSHPGATAIMRSNIAGQPWKAPKADDVSGINWLY